MVAISADTHDATAAAVQKHGYTMTMLSDESLAVVNQYNLRHDKAIATDMKRKIVRSLVVPTTLLVGADGLVKWIDQAVDYRVRSDADRVLEAVESALG